MRKKRVWLAAAVLSISLAVPQVVYGAGVDYASTVEALTKNQETIAYKDVKLGGGKTTKMVETTQRLYVSVKKAAVRKGPYEEAKLLKAVLLGDPIQCVGICENGWSKIVYADGEKNVTGYMKTKALSDQPQVEETDELLDTVSDTQLLDYPSLRDGQVLGDVPKGTTVSRTGIANDWSKVTYQDESGKDLEGYIPTSTLEGGSAQVVAEEADNGEIKPSSGKGIWSEAVNSVTVEGGTISGNVIMGDAVQVPEGAKLQPLGTFRITHYCPCSICCGPWADGITSTGVTASTNHTIAVQPGQIPYGSKVVINGQVYVAEDCGGGIGTNCIDVYVASHEEANALGVYYTDVYLLTE